jgi:hypothetical protein
MHEFKKMSYSLFDSLSDLEGSDRQRKAVVTNSEFLFAFLDEIRTTIACVLEDQINSEHRVVVTVYIAKLDSLIVAIKANCTTNRPLGSKQLRSFKSAHLSTFRRLEKAHVSVRTRDCFICWNNALLAWLSVWDKGFPYQRA